VRGFSARNDHLPKTSGRGGTQEGSQSSRRTPRGIDDPAGLARRVVLQRGPCCTAHAASWARGSDPTWRAHFRRAFRRSICRLARRHAALAGARRGYRVSIAWMAQVSGWSPSMRGDVLSALVHTVIQNRAQSLRESLLVEHLEWGTAGWQRPSARVSVAPAGRLGWTVPAPPRCTAAPQRVNEFW
jgi:hypothetical protein